VRSLADWSMAWVEALRWLAAAVSATEVPSIACPPRSWASRAWAAATCWSVPMSAAAERIPAPWVSARRLAPRPCTSAICCASRAAIWR
jgi:hypothetical protein